MSWIKLLPRRFGLLVHQLDTIHEAVTAQGDDIAIAEWVGVLLETGTRDVGAIGAAQILEVETVVAQENMRMTAGQILELIGQLFAVAGEHLAFLVHQEGELADDDRFERAFGIFRLQYQYHRCRPAALRQPLGGRAENLYLVTQPRKTDFGPGLQPDRYFVNRLSIDRSAVETAEIGEVNRTILLENARMTPRQPAHQARIVAGERLLVPADGKQCVVDDDLTQLGLGDRLQNKLHPGLCLQNTVCYLDVCPTTSFGQPPPSAL